VAVTERQEEEENEMPTGTEAIREQLAVPRQALDEVDDLLDELE
jgi:hypothetical protein